MKALLHKLVSAGPRMWGLLLAGPAITALSVYLAEIVRKPVPPVFAGKQLDFLGWSLILSIALLGIVVTALAAAKVSVKGPGGTGFDADASEDHS